MFKKIIIVSFVIFIYGCGGSGGDSNTASPIVGSWSFVYPLNGCEESYTFNSNGSWSESALDEKQSGTYTFDETVSAGERHALSIVITSDNAMSDCSGISSDDTGVTGALYVTFKNSDTTMEWYDNLTGGAPAVILSKK